MKQIESFMTQNNKQICMKKQQDYTFIINSMISQAFLRKLAPVFLQIPKYSYVRQKDIDLICQDFGETKWQQIKMYTKMFAHIGKQGFAGAWRDLRVFRKLRKIPEDERTEADWNQLVRMRHDFYRLGPLWIIQILPMSGPLFILYMYTYPGSIPSWFMIDIAHQNHELEIRETQKIAIQYFKKLQLKPEEINFSAMNLQQARKLAQCLYGYHRDGTKGYNKVFGKSIPYVISENFSKYLIKRKLKYKFNADLHYRKQLQGKNFEEKIAWKYKQVVIENKPMKPYADTLPEQEIAARRQYRRWKEQHELSQKTAECPHTNKK